MSNIPVNFKYGSTIEGKTVAENDLVVINEGLADGAESGSEKYGSVYKGTKIVGTTKADSLYTTEDITIAGGPLAGYFDDVYTNGVIPAGISLQEFISALACVEKWPNPAATASYGTLTSTLSAPTSTQSWSGSNKLVEVGTTITIGAVTASNAVANAPSLTFDNFSYGFATSTGKHTPSKTEKNPTAVAATVTTATDGVEYTLSRTYTNFTRSADHSTDSVKGAQATGISFETEDVVAVEGTNSVKFTLSVNKQVHSATVVAPSVYYALSNLGNTDKDDVTQQTVDKTTSYTYTPSPAIPAAKSSSTYSVTGVYPIFANGIKAKISADNKDTGSTAITAPVADSKMDLMTKGTAFAVSFAGQKGDGLEPYRLYMPQGTTIKSAHAIHPTIGDYSVDCKSMFVKNGTKTFTVQNVEYTYDIFEWAGTEGPNRVKFVLQ